MCFFELQKVEKFISILHKTFQHFIKYNQSSPTSITPITLNFLIKGFLQMCGSPFLRFVTFCVKDMVIAWFESASVQSPAVSQKHSGLSSLSGSDVL